MGNGRKRSNGRLPGIFGRKVEMMPENQDLAAILSVPVKHYEARPAIDGFPAYAVVIWDDDTQSRIDLQQLLAFNCKEADELIDVALTRMGHDNDMTEAERKEIEQHFMNRIVELRKIAQEVANCSEQHARFAQAALKQKQNSAGTLAKRFDFKT